VRKSAECYDVEHGICDAKISQNQEIYNADQLANLLAHVVIDALTSSPRKSFCTGRPYGFDSSFRKHL
jgi:hypothetical protein